MRLAAVAVVVVVAAAVCLDRAVSYCQTNAFVVQEIRLRVLAYTSATSRQITGKGEATRQK